MISRRAIGICLLILLASTSEAESLLRPLGFADPRPFRMDAALVGRDFKYDDDSFLHRFSYQPINPPASGLTQERDGLYGSAGSTRSDELYVVMQLQQTMPLDQGWFLRYRFQRDEDFDGRFDRNLLGVGRHLGGGWGLSFSADIEGDKARIDMETELAWRGETGSYGRLVLVTPDSLFNRKQQTAQFIRQPYTGFADLRWQLTPGSALLGFVNHNSATELRNEILDLAFFYRQTTAGLGIDSRLDDGWDLKLWLEGERGRRRHASLSGTLAAADFSRQYRELGAELVREPRSGVRFRGGLRLLRFEETGRLGGDLLDESMLRREEALLHAGFSWRINSRRSFHPIVYLGYTDADERHPLTPARSRSGEGFVGKLGLPLELFIHESNGARLILNPTLYLHRLAFGGGNVQMSIPF